MENPANCWFIAIDCLGMKRIVAAPDAMRFIALGTNARQMPSTGVLGNTWVVKGLEPSQTTYRIIGNMNYNNLHPEYVGPDLRETCVQGFSKESRKLVAQTLEVDKLPESLWELLGLALEARDIEGAEKLENRNNEVLDQVKEVLESECLRE
ncbi:hypothetical protein H0H93_015746 [Arthromyces matolae]|nr:hypothetical protein H0H93_015746 [Arthromyces matolae]